MSSGGEGVRQTSSGFGEGSESWQSVSLSDAAPVYDGVSYDEARAAKDALVGPLGWRLEQFFTRRPSPYGSRSTWHGARYLLAEMMTGGVKMRLCRIPAEHVAEAMTQRPAGEARESAEHRQMKRACLLWMRALGSKDAAEEQDYCAGIADVLSDDLNWVVECGHTGIDKPQTLMLADATTRFTLVPYQDMRRFDGKPRSLIGVDFSWTPEAVASVTAEWDAAMTRAANSLCFKPALSRLNGRG